MATTRSRAGPQNGAVSDAFDVLVIGAGPAGSAAALAARRARPDASVLLLDRAEFPRDKACGDGVAPHALDVLRRLGVDLPLRDQASVQRLTLGLAGGHAVSRDMARPARVVPRRVLDARLRDAAIDAGAVACRHRVRSVEPVARGVVVDGEIFGRVLIGADGVHSMARRALGLRDNPRGHVAVALRGYAPVRPDLADEQRIVFAEQNWPAYAWSFPLAGGRANVGYGELVPAGQPLSRARLLEGLDQLLPGAADGVQMLRAAHLPLSSRRPRQPAGRVLLAGDAASLVNPLTGEGIFYAILSGALAGSTAVSGRGDPGRAYRARLRSALGRHLRHTRAASALAHRRRVVRAAVSAAAGEQHVFDSLVEIGLGDGLLRPRLLAALAGSW